MFPAFTNIWLLGGLSAIAAPILIHLLLRRRSQRLRFSTVQFFVKKDEQSMRKRKLRNLFLLSLRIILFTLLVLAFARPFLPHNLAAGATGKRKQAILVLDRSISMQSTGSVGQQWKRAKQSAHEILAGLNADDRAALILCSTRASTFSGFVPPSVLDKKLSDLEPDFGTAQLSEGLRQAKQVLTTANPAFETSLHIISDLQRSGAQNLSTVPLPKQLSVKFHDLGDRFIPNVAATKLVLEREEDTPPHAIIASFSDEEYSRLPVTLRIDGKEAFTTEIQLTAGSTTNLALAIPSLPAGWHSAEFSIQPKDSLEADNVQYAAFRVPDPIACLVVESRKAEKAYLQESFFVTTALNPAGGGNAGASRFAYEKVSPAEIESKLQSKPGQPKIQVVFLPAAKDLTDSSAAALRQFVQNGGGLLLFLGEGISANNYNRLWRDLLPAELQRVETPDSPLRIAEFDKASPVLSLFRERSNGNLFIPEFTSRFSLATNSGARVIATFEDGAPLMIERKVGMGRVLLVNTSADTRWTDWQKHKTFVPWLHSAAFFLAGTKEALSMEPTLHFSSGTDTDIDLGKRIQVKFRSPLGVETTLDTDAEGMLRDVPLTTPGIYTLKDSAGNELRRIAANVPVSESELALQTPAELEQQLVREPESPDTPFAAGLFAESPRGKELWRLLLLGALVFLILEPLIGNRTAA